MKHNSSVVDDARQWRVRDRAQSQFPWGPPGHRQRMLTGSLLLAGVCALLATQQGYHWLLDKRCELLWGVTQVVITRSSSWPLSAASGFMTLLCGVCCRHASIRFRRIQCTLLILWGFTYLIVLLPNYPSVLAEYFYSLYCMLAQPEQSYVARPAHWWQESLVGWRLILDPSYLLSWVIGVGQCVIGVYGLSLSALFPQAEHCASCGYNLRGNVSGRCPECGQTLV